MTYIKLTINYSEDLRKNKIVGAVYSRFRDEGIKPVKVSTTHNIGLGLAKATFEFLARDNCVPTDEKLENILQELNLTDFEIKN